MYILRVTTDHKDRYVYWTVDGEHVFKIDRFPITGNYKGERDRNDRDLR